MKIKISFILMFLILFISGLSAKEISVFINNRKMKFPVPPQNIQGHLLVPMRGIFESLGAKVKWDNKSKTIKAQKGKLSVKLSPGSNIANINGINTQLDANPVIIKGTTFVPLRFIAESLGAKVHWDNGNQRVNISLKENVAEDIKKEQKTSVGTLLQVVQGTKEHPPVIIVNTKEGLKTFLISPNTFITKEEVGGKSSGSCGLEQLIPGDCVVITPLAPDSDVALFIQSMYLEIKGKIISVDGNNITLDNGKEITLNQEAIIYDENMHLWGKKLSPGQKIIARLNPTINESRYIRLISQVSSPGEEIQTEIPGVNDPVIYSFNHNVFQTLQSGDVITLIMMGTKGGNAYFDFGSFQQRIPMEEVSPGTYEAQYVVPEIKWSGEIYLTSYLEINGRTSSPIQAGKSINIGYKNPPSIEDYSPKDMTEVSDRTPAIYISFSPKSGSEINRSMTSLKINGKEVSDNAEISPYIIKYKPQKNLPYGKNRVEISVSNESGRTTYKEWYFTVENNEVPLIQSVYHDGSGKTLYYGDKLTVTMYGETGGKAYFKTSGSNYEYPLYESFWYPGKYEGVYEFNSNTDGYVSIICYLAANGIVSSKEINYSVHLSPEHHIQVPLVPTAGPVYVPTSVTIQPTPVIITPPVPTETVTVITIVPVLTPTPVISLTPVPFPTATPAFNPTSNPVETVYPITTPVPTISATQVPTGEPTIITTPVPTISATQVPTGEPTIITTPVPTISATQVPTGEPTIITTPVPTISATQVPTGEPTIITTPIPTISATQVPTGEPTIITTPVPTISATQLPTGEPTIITTPVPTISATQLPTGEPTIITTPVPTISATQVPTTEPTIITTPVPTISATQVPTGEPTIITTPVPTAEPTQEPTIVPSAIPETTVLPTPPPTPEPTQPPPPPTPMPTPPPTPDPTPPPPPPTPVPTRPPTPEPTQPPPPPTPMPTPPPTPDPTPPPPPPTPVPTPPPTPEPTQPPPPPTPMPTPPPTPDPTPPPPPPTTPIPTPPPTPEPPPPETVQSHINTSILPG